MSAHRSFLAAVAACLTIATAPFAQEHPEVLHVHDAYARLGPQSGAVFFMIHNNGTADLRLTGAQTDLAERAELHTHSEDANGVMSMGKIEGGVVLTAGDMHAFERGGDHVMLMGLTEGLKDGDVIPLTLIFEDGQTFGLDVPVDNAHEPGAMMDHSSHGAMMGDKPTD